PRDHPRAWLNLILAFIGTFFADGYTYTWSLYQRAYLDRTEPVLIHGNLSNSSLAMIGSLCMALFLGVGLVVGTLVRYYGVFRPLLLGTILLPASLILASFSTELWHLYLTQGVLVGISVSLCLFPMVHLPSQWFRKRQALASGLFYFGTCAGGVVQMQVTQVLFQRVGVRWSLRITALAILLSMTLVTCLVRERIQHAFRRVFDWTLLRRYPRLALLTLMVSIYTISFMVPFFFLPSYASFLGMSDDVGAWVGMTLTLSNGAGRVGLGWVADRYGHVNTLLISCLIAGLTSLLLWPFALSLGPLLAYAIIHGISLAGFVIIPPILAASLVPLAEGSSAVGLILGIQFMGELVGPPVFGALIDSTAPNTSYLPAEMFAGGVCILGTLLLIPFRWYLSRSLWSRV
ncbi:major facilitator superfamily domain-containing protein, partial [Piptocephalis cylindrospora]